jgi:hypothetical protein
MTVGATATVKGGFWPANGIGSLTQISGKGALRRLIAQALAVDQLNDQRELLETLNGVAPGAAALKTTARVVAAEELGGKRLIEQSTVINRATTAADVTELNADFLTLTTRTSFGATPPINKDLNPLGTR